MSRTTLSDAVLLVDDQEWTSRSVESILRPRGFAVLKAYTGGQALDLASKVSPHVIILDFRLPDLSGIDVIRELRSRRILDPVTPILMVSSTAVNRGERLEAIAAGAWEVLRHPLDPEELILRIENFARAKREAERLRHELLTDLGTGFYNVRGVLRRAREMGHDSARFGRPMACIALGPEWEGQPEDAEADTDPLPEEFTTTVARALRGVVRESDAVGRLGPGEFVIVVSGVDGNGAALMANRILSTVGEWPPSLNGGLPGPHLRLRAGVYVPQDQRAEDPEHLLSKATMALRRAQAGGGPSRIQSFEA